MTVLLLTIIIMIPIIPIMNAILTVIIRFVFIPDFGVQSFK